MKTGQDGFRLRPVEQCPSQVRRQGLTPYADFPFSGYVATDRLHWLRQDYESASDANKPGSPSEFSTAPWPPAIKPKRFAGERF